MCCFIPTPRSPLARFRLAWMTSASICSTIAGHKLYAPKGVGALYVRAGVKLEPLIHGGGHESGRRAGTESAMLAVGLGAACALARDLEWTRTVRAYATILDFAARSARRSRRAQRSPRTAATEYPQRFVCWPQSHGILANSTASPHRPAPHVIRDELSSSPVLRAMRVPERIAAAAFRFSLGRTTTRAAIQQVIERILRALHGGQPLEVE